MPSQLLLLHDMMKAQAAMRCNDQHSNVLNVSTTLHENTPHSVAFSAKAALDQRRVRHGIVNSVGEGSRMEWGLTSFYFLKREILQGT